MRLGQLSWAALFCCIAAVLVAAAWYWLRPQTDQGEAADPEEPSVPPKPSVASVPRADDSPVLKSASWRHAVGVADEDEEREGGPADGAFLNADLYDEPAIASTPLHVGEFLDADSPEATPGAPAVHVGEFIDADSD